MNCNDSSQCFRTDAVRRTQIKQRLPLLSPSSAVAMVVIASTLSLYVCMRPSPEARLRQAAKENNFRELRNLLRRGESPDVRDSFGNNALFSAVFDDHFEVVKTLLEFGADVEAVGPAGVSAMMLAAGEGHSNIVRLLLDHGADPRRQSECGQTALHYAAVTGESKIVLLLLNAGADPTAKSNDGMTAADDALSCDWVDLARYLEERAAVKSRENISQKVTCRHEKQSDERGYAGSEF